MHHEDHTPLHPSLGLIGWLLAPGTVGHRCVELAWHPSPSPVFPVSERPLLFPVFNIGERLLPTPVSPVGEHPPSVPGDVPGWGRPSSAD